MKYPSPAEKHINGKNSGNLRPALPRHVDLLTKYQQRLRKPQLPKNCQVNLDEPRQAYMDRKREYSIRLESKL